MEIVEIPSYEVVMLGERMRCVLAIENGHWSMRISGQNCAYNRDFAPSITSP